MVTPSATARDRSINSLRQSTGMLTTAAIARMEQRLPWYRELPAEQRSWVGLVLQAGIASFIDWYADPDGRAVSPMTDVFGTAPRELMRAVRLQQTVQLIRIAIEVVEDHVVEVVGERDAAHVHEGVLRYSREIAFAAAEVHARYAEARGAWDARLEALVVDSVLRGETDDDVHSRAGALGWSGHSGVAVVVGPVRTGPGEDAADHWQGGLRRAARQAAMDVLSAVQGDRLVVVLGRVEDPETAAATIAGSFGPGPLVVGPLVTDLASAAHSAAPAISGMRSACAWPDAPRPVSADALLPERVLSGDLDARTRLVQLAVEPLAAGGPVVIDTLAAYLDAGSSVEATARALFVHPNTVRYRLRRVTELSGFTTSDPRDAFALRLALTLGRLHRPPDGPTGY